MARATSSTSSGLELLFGADSTSGIVAVEARDDGTIEMWRRTDGELASSTVGTRPFLWIADEALVDGFRGEVEIEPFEGDGALRFGARPATWRDLDKLKRHLVKTSGETASSPRAPYLYIGDRVHLHLLQSGQTLFKGMRFQDLHRLQIDVLALRSAGYEHPSAERDDDRIVSIALTDSHGQAEVLDGGDERALIERLGEVIRERDPDLIEGHDLYKFQIDYLRQRAARYDLQLAWGRDGSDVRFRRSRVQIAERTIDFPLAQVYGRHCVDTWILTQFYDLSTGRSLGGYGLHDVAGELGLSGDDFVPLTHVERQAMVLEQGDAHRAHHLEDCRQVSELAGLLQASYFIQAQIFPYAYHFVIVRGQATKINALLLREHLRRRHAVPQPPEIAIPIVGGYTAIEQEGIVGPIVHCDVSSLYPSLMLAFDIAPGTDRLGLFLEFLSELRTLRLDAKAAMRKARDAGERHHQDALQSTLKIVINSFYGYLGSPFAQWADTEAANDVTGRGRELIQSMVEWLRQRDAQPVEVDTDGIYFVPPAGCEGADAEQELVAELGESLPAGIDVEVAGRYQSMLSYKVKNYALLGYDGALQIAGSGLRSRGLERYLRRFLADAIRLALAGETEAIQSTYHALLDDIAAHRLHITELMKTETLSDSLAEYRRKIDNKKRNRGAVYEVALAADHEYRPGDQISYYVTGETKRVKVFEAARPISDWDAETPDENVAYYQQKLTDTAKKFAPVLGLEMTKQGELKLA